MSDWHSCTSVPCRVWNQCMTMGACAIAPKTNDKDTDVAEWITDPVFGLVPLKEYERLRRNRKSKQTEQKPKNPVGFTVVKKATPIIASLPVLMNPNHTPSKTTTTTSKPHVSKPYVKPDDPIAGPARPAKLIRDMNDIRIMSRIKIMEIDRAIKASEGT